MKNMIFKITNLFIAIVLLCHPLFAQYSNRSLGWDLSYSSILATNNVSSSAWIRKWLASDYQPPVKKWITEWKKESIISSILIEYPAFHAAEHTTMWLFRTKNHAYYWLDIQNTKSGVIKKEVDTKIYDNLMTSLAVLKQAKPIKCKEPQSLPGYMGFLSLYDKGKSRQMLLIQEDFVTCPTEENQKAKAGRLLLALEPLIRYETQ